VYVPQLGGNRLLTQMCLCAMVSLLMSFQVNAPYYIAFLEFAWTVFTFATAGVKNVTMLYVFRFLYGCHPAFLHLLARAKLS